MELDLRDVILKVNPLDLFVRVVLDPEGLELDNIVRVDDDPVKYVEDKKRPDYDEQAEKYGHVDVFVACFVHFRAVCVDALEHYSDPAFG